MKKIDDLMTISNGRLYTEKDHVKADTSGCVLCHACCLGIDGMVELNPYDVFQLRNATNLTFEALNHQHVTTIPDGKLMIPHLKTIGSDERCTFLNVDNRCEVHGFRPSTCRLFPLGRVYTDMPNDFKYFLQIGACVKPILKLIPVDKWIAIDDYEENKKFILSWYQIVKALKFRLKFEHDTQTANKLSQYFLTTFFSIDPGAEETFYDAYYRQLPEAKKTLGIL